MLINISLSTQAKTHINYAFCLNILVYSCYVSCETHKRKVWYDESLLNCLLQQLEAQEANTKNW